jgi:hypothetical protein
MNNSGFFPEERYLSSTKDIPPDEQLAAEMDRLTLIEPFVEKDMQVEVEGDIHNELLAGLHLIAMEGNRKALFDILYSRRGEEGLYVTVIPTAEYKKNPRGPVSAKLTIIQRHPKTSVSNGFMEFSETEADDVIIKRYTQLSSLFARSAKARVVVKRGKRNHA